jgi:protein-S-isoprenylcysteine O-methyltransferase Ste14
MSTVNPTATSTIPESAPAWAAALRRSTDWLLRDLAGGPRVLKLAWVINAQKAGTFFFLGSLMWLYVGTTPAATAPAAWIYLAMHGSYGLVWLLKDMTFPDPNWQVRVTWGGALVSAFGLVMYWSFGWLLISGASRPDYPLPDAAWFCLCVSLCLLGSAIMIASDCQKYYTLRLKRGLITDGMHRYIRHPNYLGEMMIYGSFALMVGHWLPWVWLAVIWLGVFAVNMVMKEASMSRYPEWAAYKKRTWWLLPYVL